jgi:EAL domain-containing protein (putative c-di-GMP-specific phosphodiesterase class I)
MRISQRLLGLAFASADTLLEIDADGVISMAIGAGPVPGVDPGTAWLGRPLTELLGKASGMVVNKALGEILPGIRSPHHDVVVVCDAERVRRARLRIFRLPDIAPAVSCALVYEGDAFCLAVPQAPPLLDAQGLINRVRVALDSGQASEDVALAFVDVPGLTGEGEAQQRMEARIQAALQSASVDGASAARLTQERFAVLRNQGDDAEPLSHCVREAGAAEGLDIQPTTTQAGIGSGLAPGLVMRALKVALEACIESGDTVRPDQVFSRNLKATLKEADRFSTIVQNRDFQLNFQPIIDLATGNVHHFEALARFGNEGPAGTVALAEDLGLIDKFDLAVAEKALQHMRRPGYGLARVAINISGVSLGSDAYIKALLKMTQPFPDIRSRLLVEVTETAAVSDLEGAERRLGALRRAGIRVCLDDFGVGAASFEYLQNLSVDTIKIDGSFIRDVATNQRSSVMLGHMVDLCRSLKITTIAEMIETEAQADKVRELGIDMGQGFYFGRPSVDLIAPEPVGRAPVRRRQGEVAGWA